MSPTARFSTIKIVLEKKRHHIRDIDPFMSSRSRILFRRVVTT
nr:MAG TPA: hypothetical protein [Caudoviricetes sp.]